MLYEGSIYGLVFYFTKLDCGELASGKVEYMLFVSGFHYM